MARYIRQNWERVDRSLPQGFVRRAYPDAISCVYTTRRLGLKMGIVSNIPSEEQPRKELETIGPIQFFPVLVASGAVGISKPKKEIFHLAAKRIDGSPGNILFVGDDLQRDYYGAIHAGMRPVLIDRREVLKDDTNVCRVSSLEEIPLILSQSKP